MPDGQGTLSISFCFFMAWMIASPFDRKSTQTDPPAGGEFMGAKKTKDNP